MLLLARLAILWLHTNKASFVAQYCCRERFLVLRICGGEDTRVPHAVRTDEELGDDPFWLGLAEQGRSCVPKTLTGNHFDHVKPGLQRAQNGGLASVDGPKLH
jgi:hypothetical protein